MPALFIGKHPDKQIIAASHTSELASEFGRDVRNLVSSAEFKSLFPEVQLAADSTARSKWHTKQGGIYLSAGIGGPIVGMGADVLVIDDPVKSRAEAESPAYRKAVIDWYRGSAYQRLMPGGSIVVIMTRWHEEDLVGFLDSQEHEGGEKWDRLILPAFDENGGALWPEAYPAPRLKIMREVMGELEWASQYEQRPRPIEGSYFTISDMLENNQPVPYPVGCDGVFATIDSAVKTGKENDGTAVVYWARSAFHGHPLVILDWDVVQIEGALLETWVPSVFTNLERLAGETKARAGSLGTWVEDKASGMILIQQMQRRGMKVHPIDNKLTSVGKSERCINISGYISQKKVKFSEHAYNKVKAYKGHTRNHLLSQVLGFRIGTKDMGDDDLLDGFSYGVAIALGNQEGY